MHGAGLGVEMRSRDTGQEVFLNSTGEWRTLKVPIFILSRGAYGVQIRSYARHPEWYMGQSMTICFIRPPSQEGRGGGRDDSLRCQRYEYEVMLRFFF